MRNHGVKNIVRFLSEVVTMLIREDWVVEKRLSRVTLD